MTLKEATRIVLQLAESKWLWRAWKMHRLSALQVKAIRIISAQVENGVFPDDINWRKIDKEVIMETKKPSIPPEKHKCICPVIKVQCSPGQFSESDIRSIADKFCATVVLSTGVTIFGEHLAYCPCKGK